jgi:hypothetical protein
MPDDKKTIVTGIEPNPSVPSNDGELRDEDIEMISGGGDFNAAKNANNGEGWIG